MLRRRIVDVLGKLGQLNALELAGLVYGPDRPRLRSSAVCTNSQLVACRRALRRLRTKGVVVETGRRRRRKLYDLNRRHDALATISLGPPP
jgi:selenocysteine lyase/cysteine desulfurase